MTVLVDFMNWLTADATHLAGVNVAIGMVAILFCCKKKSTK